MANDQKPQVIDVYSGGGGLSLGAARAGFSVGVAVELDSDAAATHRANFPNTVVLERDATKISGEELLAALSAGQRVHDLAGLIGGPPCQGFSNIGKSDASDPRNRLFVHFFRLVQQARPRFFLAENVPGILHERYADIRREALSYVREDYDLLDPLLAKASDYGAATIRTRVFFIGVRKSLPRLDPAKLRPASGCAPVSVGAALEGLPERIRETPDGILAIAPRYRQCASMQPEAFYRRVVGKRPDGLGDTSYLHVFDDGRVNGCQRTRHTPAVERRFSGIAQGTTDPVSRAPRLSEVGLCPTLRAGTGPDRGSFQALRPIHPTQPRVITPREAARLQGFPDWFRLPDTIWHSFRQIGNSVSPIVAEQLLTPLRQRLT